MQVTCVTCFGMKLVLSLVMDVLCCGRSPILALLCSNACIFHISLSVVEIQRCKRKIEVPQTLVMLPSSLNPVLGGWFIVARRVLVLEISLVGKNGLNFKRCCGVLMGQRWVSSWWCHPRTVYPLYKSTIVDQKKTWWTIKTVNYKQENNFSHSFNITSSRFSCDSNIPWFQSRRRSMIIFENLWFLPVYVANQCWCAFCFRVRGKVLPFLWGIFCLSYFSFWTASFLMFT